MRNLETRVREMTDNLENAKERKNQLIGNKSRLQEEMKTIVAEFKKIGIEPKKAKSEVAKLEKQADEWLQDAEKKWEEFQAAQREELDV